MRSFYIYRTAVAVKLLAFHSNGVSLSLTVSDSYQCELMGQLGAALLYPDRLLLKNLSDLGFCDPEKVNFSKSAFVVSFFASAAL